MKAEQLQVFIDSVIHFFKQIKGMEPQVDTPYIHPNLNPVAFDYSGVITITGPLEGCVYVSAETPMLRSILQTMGETDHSIPLLQDLIGEIANTVSGNARRDFGAEFVISPPIVVEGKPSPNYLLREKRAYIIPLTWDNYSAVIGISLEKSL